MYPNNQSCQQKRFPGALESGILRRQFLGQATGIGGLALASLIGETANGNTTKPGENLPANLLAKNPHFAPRAKAMISLFMHGGPSHVDLLDPKPELSRMHGKEYKGDVGYSFIKRASKTLFGSPFKFAKHGKCGTEVSELLPWASRIVDDICVIRSMHTGHNGHEVSIRYFHGGIAGVTGRPTMGSWLVYGLGNPSHRLPAYMVLGDPAGHPVDGASNWSSGFMPPIYQGTVLRPTEPRILDLDPPKEIRGAPQARDLAFLAKINQIHMRSNQGKASRPDPELEARIASFELAAHMQDAAREAFDLTQEPEYIRKLYGLDQSKTRSYGERCLIARRLVERGVRFVQLFLGGQPWDNHDNLKGTLSDICSQTDQPSAALVMDLKQRGLLDTTIVHWGGEIGRLPVCEGELSATTGRDHNGQGFSIWLAGGGIKPGMTYGATDEVGHRAAVNVVNPNDFQATILNQFGLDHSKLIWYQNGRAEQLTAGTKPRIIKDILV